MPDAIFEARMRAQRYWYRDGLVEIPLGVLQLLLSGSNLIEALGNRTSSWYGPVILIYTVLFFGLAVSASRIMTAVRQRITYPRSGYVHESGRKRRTVAGMVLALLAALTVVLILRYASRAGLDPARLVQWTPAVWGLLTGGRGVRDRALRFTTVSRGGRTRHHPRSCGVYRVSL
jgi:hypothetical protein